MIDAPIMSRGEADANAKSTLAGSRSPPCLLLFSSLLDVGNIDEQERAVCRQQAPTALSFPTFILTRFSMDAGLDRSQARPKLLPPVGVAKDDELPLPPPSPMSPTYRPSPPPKMMYDGGIGHPPIYSQRERDERPPPSPQSDVLSPSFLTSPPGSPASFPGSSTSHGSPSLGPTGGDGSRSKKVNPFVDLMETEKTYVEALSGIIRVSSSLVPFVLRCFP